MRRTNLFLLTIATLFLAVSLACGGGASASSSASSGPVNGGGSGSGSGGGGSTQAAPVSEGHFVASSAPTAEPIFYGSEGTLSPVFIVAPDGSFRGELQGFQHLRGALVQNPDGTVALTGDCTWTHPDGTTEPLTLSGNVTADGHLTGTSNAGSFDLTLSQALDTPLTIDQVAGTYNTTATANGVWAQIVIADNLNSGNITGAAYASQADMLAGTNPVAYLTGTLIYADADPGHLHNVWNIGFNYAPTDGTTQTYTTYGLACFEGTTLVSLCANHLNPAAGQFSCTFAKQ